MLTVKVNQDELDQLRRIDQAARAFVEAFPADAVMGYLESECNAEWQELHEALFGDSPPTVSAP